MRHASKARGVEHTGVFERRVTPLAGMQRRPKAKLLRGSPLVSVFAVAGCNASLLRQKTTTATTRRHGSSPRSLRCRSAPAQGKTASQRISGAGIDRCADASTPFACSPSCEPPPRCGNGFLDDGEQCDNGSNTGVYAGSAWDCATGCLLPSRCGDGVQDSDFEVCDHGEQNVIAYGSCTPLCTLGPRCGDGIVDAPDEECDDGNRINNDGCNVVCRSERGGYSNTVKYAQE
jgi:cysteine-rich repeat protein